MSTDELYNLTVITGDEAAEIFIINGQFSRIASGIGKQFVFKLSRGLYSVKVRAGSETKEKPVALLSDDSITFDPIEFSSPAPLEGTGKTHEFHNGNAVENSNLVHVTIGQGSQIYIFARNFSEKERSSTNVPLNRDPATGLTLRNSNDEVLVDYGNPDIGIYSTDWEPWSACNVELNPGIYFLSLKTASGQTLQQTIVASPDWQTQVFLLQRNYGLKEKDIRADLPNGSIFMSRLGMGFKSNRKDYGISDDPDFRLTEMARQALVNDRHIITRSIESQMLDDKCNNPMLGIYGAHLLLLDKKPDTTKLLTVLGNLRKLLVQPHPDVEAIAIKLKEPSNYIFDTPPMLRLSWNYVLDASIQKPELVPVNAITSQISNQLWSADPWLVWGDVHQEGATKNNLMEQFKRLLKLEGSSGDITNISPGQLPQGVSMDMQPAAPQKSVENEYAENADMVSKDEEKMAHFVKALGVPRGKLDEMIKNLEE
ncbi:MAG: hypothetical protein ABIN89_00510 [Chitinophagaceae bacterium]